MPKKKKHSLTPRQAKFLKELAKGKTQKDAALAAGYSKSSPRQAATQALEQIRMTMPEALERAGLTAPVLIDKYLRPLMNAHETKFAQYEGTFTDSRKVKAWGARATGLDMALRIGGHYAADKAEQQTNIGVKIIIPVEVPRPGRPAIEVQTSSGTNGNGAGGKNGHGEA
jgi:hypothetical protein